jgi:hypothetical protein
VALALGTAALVLVALLWELGRPRLTGAIVRLSRWRPRPRTPVPVGYDPGRELRAEQRARALLRSCVESDDWAMYRDLGFLRVWGGLGARVNGRLGPAEALTAGAGSSAGGRSGADEHAEDASYAYLIYPHKPIIAYVPGTGTLLNEYCVAFPDHSKPYGSARLPDSDDVLAKWMALTADERRVVAEANMHLPGRQIDPDMVRRDLVRLSCWERERAGHPADGVRAA